MACTTCTVPPLTFRSWLDIPSRSAYLRRLEWSAKKLQHPNNTYSYRQRSSTEGKQQLESSPLNAKQPLLAPSATGPFLVSKAAVLQPRPRRKEPSERAYSTVVVGEFSYPDPLASEEGPLEFHKRFSVLKKHVQDTCEWELYRRRLVSQEPPKPLLLPTSHGSRVPPIHRTMAHSYGSTSSTDLVEGTDQKQLKRPALRKGISLPDMVLAIDLCSAQDGTEVSLPSGRTALSGSSATEQFGVYSVAQLYESSSRACDEREVKGPLSAEKKTVKKKSKAVPVVSDNPVEECVRPTAPAPSIAKQTRKKKHSSSRPPSAKLVHKSAKKLSRTYSAK